MENLVVSTFQDAGNASEALKKLNELDQIGDINIYNYAMIRKTGENKFDMLQQDGPDFEDRPLVGAITGSAIGLIGGPIGWAVGLITGTLIGTADGYDGETFSDEFLGKVSGHINMGTVAIVLDVEEENEFFINSYMEPFNGITVHTNLADQYDRFDQEQWDELDEEIKDEEKSLKSAAAKNKASIQAKIDKLKSERKERITKIKLRAAKRKEHLENKIKAMDERIKKSGENEKAKLKAQREKIIDNLKKFNGEVAWAFSAEY